MIKSIPDTLRSGIILSFDFGMKKTGVAMGELTLGSAKPLQLLTMQHGKHQPEQLAALIKEWQPVGFVVGCPVHLDGEASAMTRAAQKFARRISEQHRLPCSLVDERLSSYIAEEIHTDAEHFWYKMPIDAISAALILETWFSQRTT